MANATAVEHGLLLTADLPGIGGRIRNVAEDFEVEEIPAYELCGRGEHLFLWIEKRGVAAERLLEHVAGVLGIPPREVGSAGLKDRHAVTRQYVSVPRAAEPRLGRIDCDRIRLLRVSAHTNKLRAGHLRGNRFRIVVREVTSDAQRRARAIQDVLLQHGLPNYFGPQRFGRRGETAQIGLALLRGEIRRPPGPPERQRFLRKLALSAAQANLFNRYLTERMTEGLLGTVLDGDVMHKATGGIFYVTDRVAEQGRFDRRETVHAGPIFGKKMFAAHGEAQRREQRVLEQAEIEPARLAQFGKLLAGTRRANLVYVDGLVLEPVERGLQLSFSLPAGSYATVLLRELMKSETEPAQ